MGATDEASCQSRHCDRGVARAFAMLGKRWNGMLLGTLMDGPASFSQLSRAVGGISDSMLSERLGELAAACLIRRHVDEGPPVTVTYELSDAGRALIPALQELSRWASRYADRAPAEP
jgi:DNA-binding HxlR family transcriptional regulator